MQRQIINFMIFTLFVLTCSAEAQVVQEWSIDIPYQNEIVVDRDGNSYAVEMENPSTTITKFGSD